MATSEARPPTDLRDRPFRAAAKLAPPGGAGSRSSITALAVLAIAVLGLGLFGPRSNGVPNPDRVDPERTVPPDHATPIPPVRLAEPAVDGAVLPPPIPVLIPGGGIRWADPVGGGLSEAVVDGGGRAAAFMLADGSLVCVCLESPWRREGRTVRAVIIRIDPDGRMIGGGQAFEASTPVGGRRLREGIVLDAALDAPRNLVHLASAVRGELTWEVTLDVLDASDGTVLGSRRLATPPSADALLPPIVRVAPDGASVRVAVVAIPNGFEDRAATDQVRTDWLIPVVASDLRPAILVPSPRVDGTCTAEAFITSLVYARVCRVTPEPAIATVVLLEAGAEASREAPLGRSNTPVPWQAVADPARGRLILWDPYRHEMVTVDAATAAVQTRFLPEAGEVHAAVASGPRPAPDPGRVAWGATESPFMMDAPGRLTGSPDGSLVLAAGLPEGRARGSSGVWVFDARSLQLVERWSPAAAYVELAYTADGRHVLAMGESLVDTHGRPAPWGRSLAIHDAVSGRLLAVMGAIEGNVGTPLAFPIPAE